MQRRRSLAANTAAFDSNNAAMVSDIVSYQTALATGEVNVLCGGRGFAVSVLDVENPYLDWVHPEEGGIPWQQAPHVVEACAEGCGAQRLMWQTSGAPVMSPRNRPPSYSTGNRRPTI